MSADENSPKQPQRRLARRVALVNGIAVLFLLALAAVWFAADALLLIFACTLVAILLYELSDILHRHAHIHRRIALVIVVVSLLLLVGLGGWALAPEVADQASRLAQEIPAAVERVRQFVAEQPMLRRVAGELPPPEELFSQLSGMLPRAGLLFGGLLGAIGNAVIILFVGIYFAATPGRYLDGFIKLIPQAQRPRAREVLNRVDDNLSDWLVGKALSMLIVAITTSVGLHLLGVPLALILGIIAGLLDFIPYLGPVIAGVPAVLLAFTISPELALYTILLFIGIQTLQGYGLQPLVEGEAASLAPALVIVMQLIFGSLFGFAGVALATPLTAALAVVIDMLYVQDVLGDTPALPSEDDKKSRGLRGLFHR